jgi:dipeptidyl aminopeptidase/acylaminoacyl peptidase
VSSDRVTFFQRTASLFALATLALAIPAFPQQSGADREKQSDAVKKPAAHSRDGKKLFGSIDALRVHNVGNVRLSPDGSRLAFTSSQLTPEEEEDRQKSDDWKSISELWITQTAAPAGSEREYTHVEKSVSAPEWFPDGKRLAFVRAPETESDSQIWFQWVDGGDPRKVTSHKGGLGGIQISPDGQSIVFASPDQPSKEAAEQRKQKNDAIVVDHDLRMAHLWLYNIAAKTETRLTSGDFTVSDARWSPDGTQISFTSTPSSRTDDLNLSSVWILNVATKQKRKLLTTDLPNHTARWSSDGKWIAYLGNTRVGGVSKTDLFVIQAAEGSTARKLTSDFELDPGTPVWSADGRKIYFSGGTRETTQIFATDVAAGKATQLTDFPGVFQLETLSNDGRFAFGDYTTATHPGDVYKVDLQSRTLTAISNQNTWLNDYAVGDSEVIKWKSDDGTEIEGVLTKPVDFDPSKKYPFLLNPHGGPTGSSVMSFSPTVQVMAANGYLVLQPNFRGSTGRGLAFAQANKNTWGQGDYQDCISGVKAVEARGWADPDRLGAFGWSYGGYMTFWILTQTNMFKAVSPGAGLTDIYAMYSETDIQRYIQFFFGEKSPWDNREEYWDHSPMKYVENVKTPTLILQGQQDTRVPFAQPQEFYHALLERGVPVEFVLYPRENHGFTEPRHIQDRLNRYLTFFGKYLNNPSVTDAALSSAH